MNDNTKICKKCEKEYPLTSEYFRPNPVMVSGWESDCRLCKRAYFKAYYQANKSKILKKNADWEEANKQKRAVIRKRAYQNNNGKERSRLSVQKWREKLGHEEVLKRGREWRSKNPERIKTYWKQSRSKRRAWLKSARGKFSSKDILSKYELQGGLCYYCKVELEAYHVDHKIPLSRGGTNWPSNLCCSCSTCNLRKNNTPFFEFLARFRKPGEYLFGQ